jgi:phosphodiesterase/alkaline phosphatase D-like protein
VTRATTDGDPAAAASTRPLGAHHVPDAAVPWLRRLARLWGAVGFLGWLFWRLRQGIPQAGEEGSWQASVELALWFLAVVGYVTALEWEIVGATIMAVAGAGMALWTSQFHEPPFGLMILMMFFAPAVPYWLIWQRYKPIWRVVSLGVLLVGILVAGSVGAVRVYESQLGPTHPASSAEPLPDSPVTWAWSGAVTTSSAEVRARIEEEWDAVRLAVATTADFASARYVDGVAASADDPGLVRFVLDGLDAATDYHYAVEVDGTLDTVRAGTFGTFGEGAWDFVLTSGACARIGSNGAVFDAMRSIDPDLYVMYGDLHYGDVATNDRDRFRELYDGIQAQPGPAAFYRSVPWDYVWDDHDYGPNDADATSDSRPAAQTVYREAVPHYPLVLEGQQPIYHAFTVGRARVIVTDTRSERSPKEDPDGPLKTMLGAAQRDWLLAELAAADEVYPLIIWVSSVPWIAPADAGADHWGGYGHERRLIADFIAENEIDGLLMLAGDAHMVAIDDGTNSDYSTGGSGAGFPVLQAAALDRPGSAKGGPYSNGSFPGGGRFGVVEVQDDGDSLTVTLKGTTWDGIDLTSLRYTIDATEEASAW